MIEGVNQVSNSGINFEAKPQVKEKESKSFVSDNKVLISVVGAVAIAAAVTGGILAYKSHKLTEEIESLYKQGVRYFENNKKDAVFTKFFDADVSINQLKDIMKLPKNERLSALKDAELADRGFLIRLNKPENYKEQLPQNIQDAVNEKDYLKAKKLYIKYCDSLFKKSETAGETVEESVERIFGKDSVVKPHTYSPQDDELIVMNNYTGGAGFKTAVVTSKNEIASGLNWKASEGLLDGCNSHGVLGHMPKEDATPLIQSGKANERHYVSISYGSKDSGQASYGFTLFSTKGGEMTQSQKDLKNLDTSKMSKEDIKLLFKLPRDREKSNYDAVLSLVQTLAQKYKA